MNKGSDLVQPVSNISTSTELEQRLEARGKPRAELQLTINGWEEQTVHQQVNETNEIRIKHLQRRLERVRTGFQHDHTHAQINGKAKADFERSR